MNERMKEDWDTQEQSDMFDEFLDDTSDSRSQTWKGWHGYDELEWEAFQYGWNAAKVYFGVKE
jgi:hypothetical protein